MPVRAAKSQRACNSASVKVAPVGLFGWQT